MAPKFISSLREQERLPRLLLLALSVFILTGIGGFAARSQDDVEDRCVPQKGRFKIDLVFIIDRSGSLDSRRLGQTYNIQIESVMTALGDPTIIPRDGSVAVAIFTFADDAALIAPLTEINSTADAEALARTVEQLKCSCDVPGSCPACGSRPASNFTNAIRSASIHISQQRPPGHPRFLAKQVILMSTEGGCTDPDCGKAASNEARQSAEESGRAAELSVSVLGFGVMNNEPDCSVANAEPINLGRIRSILFRTTQPVPMPEPFIIEPGNCNEPARPNTPPCQGPARICDSDAPGCDQADRRRQVMALAEQTRTLLRAHVKPIILRVTTGDDPPPGTPVVGEEARQRLSLRQAIEMANENGGKACIVFDTQVNDMLINPRVPLPALCAPDIVIDGLARDECGDSLDSGKPRVDIVGLSTDTLQGERHEHGILIRSNRCVIRGLAIGRFKQAGIAAAPICPFDNVGANLIELNSFDSNRRAAILVLDPTGPGPNTVSHNTRNRISANNVIGSTPIDLGGDGPTPNDRCDADEGPNEMLNFPDRLNVTRSGNKITIDGLINADPVACPGCPQDHSSGTVEIFSVTQFLTSTALGGFIGQASSPLPIQGVSFLARVTPASDGSFQASGLPSMGSAYTATFTDGEGNTSEMKIPCSGFPLALIRFPPSGLLAFGPVDPGLKARQLQEVTGSVLVQNVGCATLRLDAPRIDRQDSNPRITDVRDPFFKITPQIDSQISLEPGETGSFTVTFTPSIPAVVTKDREMIRGLRAGDLLPSTVFSRLIFPGPDQMFDPGVTLQGFVTQDIRLINCNGLRRGPKVFLVRSGDQLTVTFSVFDSNLDVTNPVIRVVSYEFFDSQDNQIPLQPPDTDLARVVRDRTLLPGQSFTVIQRFSGANDNPGVASVRVTVEDGDGNRAVAAGSLGKGPDCYSAANSAAIVSMPVVRLTRRDGEPVATRHRSR